MKSALTIFADSVSLEEAILAIDWSASELGPPSAWPQSLRSVLALILASDKPMFIVWGASRTLLYNDAYVALLGSRHPRALGMPFFSVWPDAASEAAPLFDRLFGGSVIDLDDISISFDHRQESPGSHFALSYTPIRDQGQQVVGLLCIHSETTAPVPGKVLQPRDHKRLTQMFELAPSFIAVLHGPQHRIELANAGFWRLTGERARVGQTFAEALPDAAARGYVALLDHAYATGERVVRTAARLAVHGPGAGVHDRVVDIFLQPISDGIGQVTGIFVHGSDITERSEQLLAKEALIQTVYEHSTEYHLVFAQLRAGVFLLQEVNPAALKLYKTTRAQVIGRTVDECLSSAAAAVVNARLTACLEANAPHEYEFVHEGNIIEGIASPLPAVRGVGRQIAVRARDVTERRNLEEQLRQSQKMEAVGQLTGGLAHDFNNLLSGISGSLELINTRRQQGRLDEVDRYLAAAQAAARRAAALTHRLLAFARRQTLDPKAIDLNRLVEGMDDLIRRMVEPAVRVAIVESAGLWLVLVDPNQMENALLNLCINARDAMPNGGELRIETHHQRFDQGAALANDCAPGEYVSLSVSDDGVGMAPEVLARAFEPFFTTKPLGEGTGLGLSMIYGFARQSGGRVRIESALGRGTTVWIDLPRHVGPADLAT
jgi:PAS domain S-box-containing protein